VTDSEGVLGIRIDLLDFSIFLLEELETEVKFFLGTIRNAEAVHVTNEGSCELVVVHFGTEVAHSEEACRFTDELHLILFIIKR
jgi:hypothetical protein